MLGQRQQLLQLGYDSCWLWLLQLQKYTEAAAETAAAVAAASLKASPLSTIKQVHGEAIPVSMPL